MIKSDSELRALGPQSGSLAPHVNTNTPVIAQVREADAVVRQGDGRELVPAQARRIYEGEVVRLLLQALAVVREQLLDWAGARVLGVSIGGPPLPVGDVVKPAAVDHRLLDDRHRRALDGWVSTAPRKIEVHVEVARDDAGGRLTGRGCAGALAPNKRGQLAELRRARPFKPVEEAARHALDEPRPERGAHLPAVGCNRQISGFAR